MKYFIILLTIMIISSILMASTEPALIISNTVKNDVNLLNKMNISIDNVRTNNIVVYVNDNDYLLLEKLGFDIHHLPNQAKIYAQQLQETTKNSDNPMNEYYSIDEYNSFMIQTAQQYPEICQLFTAGYSVQNRPIYFMKISDNVNNEENEPEVRITSTIHGDEVVGYDLMLRLINLLTSEYVSNERIANIVNSTEIWINPLTNPDGYVLNQRENANEVDLNRSFPCFALNDENELTGAEPELLAQKNFADNHSCNISLNYHGGAQVINYPWDCITALHPDDDVFVDLALTYAIENPEDLYNSTEFTHGITNGAAWYIVNGSMQDWLNFYYSCMDMTVEISNTKWPPANTLDAYWTKNKEALLKYLEKVKSGLHGIVTDTDNNPLSAQMLISNRQITNTDPQVGDYHRLLMPGTYSLTFRAYGYDDYNVDNVIISPNQATNLNVSLTPKQQISFKGYVRDNNNQAIANANIILYADTERTALTDENGYFEINQIYNGNYNVKLSAADFMPFLQNININNQNVFNFVLTDPIFTDNFENGLSAWQVQSPWAIQNLNNNNFLSDSPDGDYNNNITKTAKIIQGFDLNSAQCAVFSYDVNYALENNYDFLFLEVSTNNSSWTTLKTYTGSSSNWINDVVDLTQYIGHTIYLRFKINSDQSQNADGVFLDNVKFNNQNYYSVGNDDIELNKPFLDCVNYPNPFNSEKGTAFIISSNLKAESNLIEIFNIKGQKIKSINTDNSKAIINWDGRNANHRKVASGIYFYRVSNKNLKSTIKKMTILN